MIVLDIIARACIAGLVVGVCDYFIVGSIDHSHLFTVMIWYSLGLYLGWQHPLGEE